jgi:uncharacterized membrane protein
VILLVRIPAFNALFDAIEWRRARRRTSDRPHALRILHTLGMEATSIVVMGPPSCLSAATHVGHLRHPRLRLPHPLRPFPSRHAG